MQLVENRKSLGIVYVKSDNNKETFPLICN